MQPQTKLLFVAATMLPLCGVLPAQAASSKNYFLVASETAAGQVAQNSKHVLVASCGDGVVSPTAKTSRFVLDGGLVSALQTPAHGQPWLTHVMPRFATPRGAANLTLFGTEMNLGSGTAVRIGGQPATVGAMTQHTIATRLPSQPQPGWQPVVVSSSAGSTTLAQGIGILPMMMTEPAPAPDVGFEILFKGSQGDQVVWAAGVAPATPMTIPGFNYGLAIHPAALLIMPGFTIPAASGEFRFRIPATPYTGSIYAQALFASNNPGYRPGSFSNVLEF